MEVAIWIIVALLIVIAGLLKMILDQQTSLYLMQSEKLSRLDQMAGRLYTAIYEQSERIEKAVYAVHHKLLNP